VHRSGATACRGSTSKEYLPRNTTVAFEFCNDGKDEQNRIPHVSWPKHELAPRQLRSRCTCRVNVVSGTLNRTSKKTSKPDKHKTDESDDTLRTHSQN
jgi:hypothetical protein